MERGRRIVFAIKRNATRPVVRYWIALDTDYKSVVCALLILGIVLAFNPQIPG